MQKRKVLHIITGLRTGGAERMLARICTHKSDLFEYEIVVLNGLGPIAAQIRKTHVPIHDLKLKNPLNILKLFKIIKDFRPHLIQSWMYHSDFVAALVGPFFKIPVFWNIRQTVINTHLNKFSTVAIFKINSWLSFIPHKILSCSHEARKFHIRHGYKNNFFVIPNGIQLPKIDKNKKEKLIIHVGRYAPLKDHASFLRLSGHIEAKYSDYNIEMYGDGVSLETLELAKLYRELGLKKTRLMGRNDDIAEVYQRASILISTSLSEGFSNVILESMAYEVNIIATDVGDSAYIVNNPQRIVPAGNDDELRSKTDLLLNLNAEDFHLESCQNRQRVSDHFDILKVVKLYEEYYAKI